MTRVVEGIVWLGCLALLAGCQDQSETERSFQMPELAAARTIGSPATRPDLASCERYAPVEDAERLRDTPLPVPPTMAEVLAADLDHYAVQTLGGKTLCLDTRWMDSVDNLRLSDDGRFLSFDWVGYEIFGHQVVDRTGAGQAIDTGVAPLASPSGKRLAALDYSESGFGSLNAFAVWDIGAARLAEAGRNETLPDGYDWRLDRWVGENCLELSSVGWDDLPQDPADHASAPRQRFVGRLAGNALKVEPATAGGCSSA